MESYSILSPTATDLPRHVIIKADERAASIETHEMDVVCLVKRNAADDQLDQEPSNQTWYIHMFCLVVPNSYDTCLIILGSAASNALWVHAALPELMPKRSPTSASFDDGETEEVPGRGGCAFEEVPFKHYW